MPKSPLRDQCHINLDHPELNRPEDLSEGHDISKFDYEYLLKSVAQMEEDLNSLWMKWDSRGYRQMNDHVDRTFRAFGRLKRLLREADSYEKELTKHIENGTAYNELGPTEVQLEKGYYVKTTEGLTITELGRKKIVFE